jgi:hypothetical protein
LPEATRNAVNLLAKMFYFAVNDTHAVTEIIQGNVSDLVDSYLRKSTNEDVFETRCKFIGRAAFVTYSIAS